MAAPLPYNLVANPEAALDSSLQLTSVKETTGLRSLHAAARNYLNAGKSRS